MEATDLLAREQEFKKLNKQLEKKTESLMKEIELAMQKQDIFSEFSHKNLSLTLNHTTKKHCCDTPKKSSECTPKSTPNCTPKRILKKPNNYKKANDSNLENESFKSDSGMKSIVCSCCALSPSNRVQNDLEFLYAFVTVGVQENVLPKSFLKERPTVESVFKFLSFQVKLLQEQIDQLQGVIKKKEGQCEAHLSKLAELEGERLALQHKAASLQAAATSAGVAKRAALQKLEESERQLREKRSEADKASLEAKRLRSRCATLEARCLAHDDAQGRAKLQVEEGKRREKELRESMRALSANHFKAINQLETRCTTLANRSARQDELVRNLRKQVALLAANHHVAKLEHDYRVFLETF